jgi:hypothetical protein
MAAAIIGNKGQRLSAAVGQEPTVKAEKCRTFERRVTVGKLPLRQREIVLECFE